MNKKVKKLLLALLYLFLLGSQIHALFRYAKNGVNEVADIIGLIAAIAIIIYAGLQCIDLLPDKADSNK